VHTFGVPTYEIIPTVSQTLLDLPLTEARRGSQLLQSRNVKRSSINKADTWTT
jgi:hypothetical protein